MEHQITDERVQGIIFEQVEILQRADSRKEFDGICLSSLPLLNQTCPLFYDYFYSNYIKIGARFPSEQWSSYLSQNFKNRTNNVIESKNQQIKTKIGKGLSEIRFVMKAKEFSETQIALITSQRNRTWDQILNEEIIDMVILFNFLLFELTFPLAWRSSKKNSQTTSTKDTCSYKKVVDP
jgi:hypothetical protein